MKKESTYIVLLVFLFRSVLSFGQDVSFSQYYANPLYLNPAFAGSTGVPRVALQYRNQWHHFNDAFNTYSAAFDMPVEKLQGGIGLNILNDAQAGNLLNSLQINLSYSVYIQLSQNYKLHGGVQVGMNQKSIRTDQLVFADNVDPNYGNHGISAEVISDPNFAFADFATGVLIFSEKTFGGIAVHHLTEPNQSFVGESSDLAQLNRKYTAHFGARLPVYLYGHHRKKFDISPQLIVQKQGNFNQINYGLFATKQGFTGGLWFRQNFGIRYDAVILMVGFFKETWQINYSYDWTVSGLWGDTGGTSEISLTFLLKSIDERRSLPFYNQYKEKFGVR